MKKVLLYFLSFILIQVLCSYVITAIWSAIQGNSDITAERIITMSSVSSVISIIVFTLAKWTPFSREFMQSRPWVLIYWSIIIALGMIIPSQFLEELLPSELTKDILTNEFKMIMGNNWGYLAVGLLAPLTEELVFRGAIQKAAIEFFSEKFEVKKARSQEVKESRSQEGKKAGSQEDKESRSQSTLRQNLPHWIGIIFTSMLFAAVHGNPAQMPHALLVGMLLGWMCYRSGSIVPGIVVHWVNNTAAFLMYALYPQTYDMHLQDLFGNSPLRVAMAVLLSLLLFIPAVYQYHYRTKK